MQPDTLAHAVTGALEDIKARDISVLDVRQLTSLFDIVIVASADSARQTKALSRHVQDCAKDAGGRVYGVEGEDSGEWVLVDLGDVVVHIMQPAIRDYYNLEELWGGQRQRPTRADGSDTDDGGRAPATATADTSQSR
ncbi:MAG: ribosome silencing factor [Betaproteobacteria bacterium]|nr:ribosome silencing factor [Betaproteobacteria bacterium]